MTSIPNARPAVKRTTKKHIEPGCAKPITAAVPPLVTSVTPTPIDRLQTKPLTKQAQLIAMLVHDDGATLNQMVAATGWLPHTTRAALTGLRKRGYVVTSDKVDGVRSYRANPPAIGLKGNK